MSSSNTGMLNAVMQCEVVISADHSQFAIVCPVQTQQPLGPGGTQQPSSNLGPGGTQQPMTQPIILGPGGTQQQPMTQPNPQFTVTTNQFRGGNNIVSNRLALANTRLRYLASDTPN